MKSTPIAFRFRFLILGLLYVMAFTTPWNYWLHLDGAGVQAHTWGILASKLGHGSLAGFNILLLAGTLLAALGAALRVWAAAYLGSGVVRAGALQGGAVVADGPYRYMRNPLYVGLFLHTFALALLMPPSGAVFALVAVALFEVYLAQCEGRFLAATLGENYLAYRKRVPSVLPSVTPQVAASGARPRWWQAVLGEIYMIGVVLSFAILGWRYDAQLLTKCVLIALGVSLVVRAALPRPQAAVA